MKSIEERMIDASNVWSRASYTERLSLVKEPNSEMAIALRTKMENSRQGIEE